MIASPDTHADAPPLLEARGLSKSFPGVRALDAVDFTLRRGEVHALMGENGAGKSTLIKLLTGVHRRDAGEVRLRGRVIHPRSPLDAQRLGISPVYQEVNLAPQLSVAENVTLGREPRRWGRVRWRALRRQAESALATLGLELDVRRPLGACSIAVQQMVAIARAVDIDARVLILDEPTSSLDADEAEQLFAVMRRLKARGLGIVFVTHFLDQVFAVSDRITVLRGGRRVGTHDAAALGRLELVSAMIGRGVEQVAAMQDHDPPPPPPADAPAAARAAGLCGPGLHEPVDLEVRRGEVVGLAGLLGSGRTELARLLFGADRATAGRVEIGGRPVRLTSPRRAIRRGVGFTPEDRKAQAIVPELSVRENIVLALQANRPWLTRLGGRAQRALAQRYIAALGIATPSAEKPVGQLSGGNQQKVVLARWLAMQPRLLILDEPTRGIDVGAKAEVMKLIVKLCGRGLGIVLISSELPEVARVSHRVAVMRDRRKVGELAGDGVTVQTIMRRIADDGGSDGV